MRMRTFFTSLALIVLTTSLGLSQYSARESFEYPKGDSLAAVTGLAINGWANSWTYDNGTSGLMAIGTADLPYGDLTYPITNIGNHVTVSNPGNWVAARYTRNLDKVWPDEAGKVYWTSLIFEAKGVPTGNTYYLLKLFSGSGEIMAIGKSGGGTTYSCGSGWAGGTGDDVSSVTCEGGPVWLVTKTVMSGDAGNERTYMWIDPDPSGAEPDTNDAKVKRWTTMSSGFDNIRLECGGADSLQTNWDELRLGTSWSSVSSTQYSARESFEYTQGDSLAATTGQVKNGWADSWTYDNGTSGLMAIGTADLPYGDLNYPITNIGNHVTVSNPGNWVAARYMRNLDKVWPDEAGKVYWTSFIFEAKGVPTGNTYYLLKLFSGSGEIMAIGKSGGGTTYSCGSGWAGGTGDDVSSVTCEGGPVWLVTKTVMSGDAGNERTYMWIDPDPSGAEPDTNDAKVKRWTTMSSGFDNVRLECGGADSLQINWDELRIGTDWASVALPLAPTGVNDQPFDQPKSFGLSQNYPNPFNPTTRISYTLENSSEVRLTVYNVLGKEVTRLVSGFQSVGTHTVEFNATNLTSGVYFYQLQTGNTITTKKMLLLK